MDCRIADTFTDSLARLSGVRNPQMKTPNREGLGVDLLVVRGTPAKSG